MKTILVTGGAGFIGSNFIKFIQSKAPTYKIINLDALTYAGRLENLENIGITKHVFIKGDITDHALIQTIFENHPIDSVINFAAESHVDRSILSPDLFVKTNILGTQTLLDLAKKNWKINPQDNHCKHYKKDVKFIQISTDEVYGSLEKEQNFDESSPLLPSNPYAASKASADLLCNAYHQTYGFPVVITRCSNNYGPFQYPEKLIPLAITRALNNSRIPIYGDGLQSRDWLHVSDHCSAIYLALLKGISGETYNISANCDRHNIDVIQMILKKMNKPLTLVKHVKDRPGHDFRYALNSKKIQHQLGWSAHYTFEDGLNATVEWYLNNFSWLSSINSRRSSQ